MQFAIVQLDLLQVGGDHPVGVLSRIGGGRIGVRQHQGRTDGEPAERLHVDAAIIFADLLLPFEPMGLPFEFTAGEGPKVKNPVRTAAAIDRLDTLRAAELGYVAESIGRLVNPFADAVPVIGFCGAPFTLASYMIEGAGSRHYIETKKLMYGDEGAWNALMQKLVTVLAEYGTQQVRAGAAAVQGFDAWVGRWSPDD